MAVEFVYILNKVNSTISEILSSFTEIEGRILGEPLESSLNFI
jgi:hypothetical protein